MLLQARWYTLRVLVAGLLAGLCTMLAANAASAHADLKSSDPPDGAVLAVAPDAVTFTFTEDILEQGNAVTLTVVQTGDRLPLDPPRVDGAMVSVDWPASSPAGDVRAAFRVVSADGHPIEGTVTFTVRQGVGAPDAAPVAAAAEPSAGASAAAPASPRPTGADDSGEPAEGDGRAALLFFLALGAAVVAGAYAGLWFMRKAR